MIKLILSFVSLAFFLSVLFLCSALRSVRPFSLLVSGALNLTPTKLNVFLVLPLFTLGIIMII